MKHQFCLYWPLLSDTSTVGTYLSVTDQSVVHQLRNVLRCRSGNSCILFNRRIQVVADIITIEPGRVKIQITQTMSHQPLMPFITFGLPLLKRSGLQEAVYGVTEAGANRIQLLYTDQAQRSWGGAHEQERLERIIVAAAQQAKQFIVPELYPPISLSEYFSIVAHNHLLYFDPHGDQIQTVLPMLIGQKKLYFLIGPEADLSRQEKSLIVGPQQHKIRLTPTVLRAQQAAGVSVCVVRSLLP